MNGPNIFSYPIVGGFVFLIFSIIFVIFLSKFLSHMLEEKGIMRIFEVMKLFVIVTPIIIALVLLINFQSIDLVGYLNFTIIFLIFIYFIEFIMKYVVGGMRK